MDQPPEKNEPKHGRENELNDCHHESPLNQLSESRDEKTANRSDDVAGGTLACHGNTLTAGNRCAMVSALFVMAAASYASAVAVRWPTGGMLARRSRSFADLQLNRLGEPGSAPVN
jgi:hypothetical protein